MDEVVENLPKKLRLTIGLTAAAMVVSALFLANLVTTDYGFIPVGFGFEATAGTLFAGIMLSFRDAVQDTLGRKAVVLLILIGTAISLLVSAPAIAIAAAVAFGAAELLDFAVYTPIRERASFGDRRWAIAVVASNVVGALTDTILFLGIAFGMSAIMPALPGQMVGKLWATLFYLAVGWVAAYAWKKWKSRKTTVETPRMRLYRDLEVVLKKHGYDPEESIEVVELLEVQAKKHSL